MTNKLLLIIILFIGILSPHSIIASQETTSSELTIMYDTAYDKLNTNSSALNNGLADTSTTVVDGSLDSISSDTDIVFAPGTLGITDSTITSVNDWFYSGDKRLIVVSSANDLYNAEYITTNDSQRLIDSLGNNYTEFHDERYIQEWLVVNDTGVFNKNEHYNVSVYDEHAVSDREYNQYVSYSRDPIFNFTNDAYDDQYIFKYPSLLTVRHANEEGTDSFHMIPHDNPSYGLIIMMGRRSSQSVAFGVNNNDYQAEDLEETHWRALFTIQETETNRYIITMASPTQFAEFYSPVWNGIFNWFENIPTNENPDLNTSNSESSSENFLIYSSIYLIFIPIIVLIKKRV